MADEFAKRAAAMKARIEERRTNSSARGLGTSGSSIGATPAATAPTTSAATSTSSPSETPASTTPTGATPTASSISSGPRASMARGSAGGAPRGSFRTPSSGRLGTTGAAAGSPSGPGAANQRNLQLANTELKMLQMKYDAEVRRRQSLEEQLKAANEARDSAAPSTPTSASRQDSAPKVGGATRVSMAPGSRSSRQSVAPGAKGINILETISRVLVEMEKLEGNFRRAEAGRAQAETELLEVAMMKQVADENLQTLHSDLNRIISNFESQLQTFQSLIIAMDKSGLEQLKTTLERTHGELKARVSEASQQGSTERVNKRATVLLQQINLGGPPPPGPPPPSAPPLQTGPPGPPRGGPTRAPGSIRGASGGDNNPRASTLLSQIRRGKDLNKIDIDEVKRERQRTIQNNRQSMALFSSLQDTLRAALNCRQDNMNLYNDDNGDDWDD